MYTGLSNEQIAGLAPSVFATRPWDKVSDKYTFIPTSIIVEDLRYNGFEPVSATQSYTRIQDKKPHTKHMLRFRERSVMADSRVVGTAYPEMVLVNSHDRGSSYSLYAGLFVLVCSNGMVIQDQTVPNASFNVSHRGNVLQDVLEASLRIAETFPRIINQMYEFKSITLSEGARFEFAEASLLMRWPDGKAANGITAQDLLTPRRQEDNNPTLWSTLQVVQENLLKGRLSAGRWHRGIRQVKSVDSNVDLNTKLWQLAVTRALVRL